MEVLISRSNRADKRLKAEYSDKTVHFGQAGGSTYADHGDPTLKSNWEKRHRVRENWSDLMTPGAMSKHVLWNQSSIKASIAELNRKQQKYKYILRP